MVRIPRQIARLKLPRYEIDITRQRILFRCGCNVRSRYCYALAGIERASGRYMILLSSERA